MYPGCMAIVFQYIVLSTLRDKKSIFLLQGLPHVNANPTEFIDLWVSCSWTHNSG